MGLRLSAAALFALLACGKTEPAKTAGAEVAPEPVNVATASPSEAALAAFAQFECTRCHEGLALPTPPQNKQCVGCHEEILAGTYAATPELLAKWQKHIVSLPVAPSLVAIGSKFTRSWVQQQLQSPVDTRPALLATMPRLRISEAQAALMAEALVPEEMAPKTFPVDASARGKELFAEYACASCHSFGSTPRINAGGKANDAVILAPDLAHTRQRFQSGRLVAWLMNPQKIQPATLMPNLGLSQEDAASLASYLWHDELTPTKVLVPERLPVLKREVSFDEVFAQVFRKVCWHCHSSEDYARGDGGPGNTGGFGFAAKGLDLSTYQGVQSGSFGDDGRRRSVFVRDEEGVPLLVRVMLLRQLEEAGDAKERRGMPLGFESMSPTQIQLVESWIEQGRPR